MNTKGLDYTLLALVIVGAVNWGLIGLFRFDLVSFLFGDMSWLTRIIYGIVGIGGLYLCSVFGCMVYRDTITFPLVQSGKSLSFMEMLKIKLTWNLSLIESSLVIAWLISPPSNIAMVRKLSKYISSRS